MAHPLESHAIRFGLDKQNKVEGKGHIGWTMYMNTPVGLSFNEMRR